MRKESHWKRYLSVGAVALTTVGLMAFQVNADNNTVEVKRGTVRVDQSDFILVHTTTDDTDKYGFDKAGSSYRLKYENRAFDWNYIGVAYRSKKKYDMTDVSGLGIYGFADDKRRDDVILHYISPNSNTYYHTSVENQDMTSANTCGWGNGVVYDLKDFYNKKEGTYMGSVAPITIRSDEEYVYLEMAHSDSSHKAVFTSDDESRSADGKKGYMYLDLVDHSISVIKPETLTRVTVNSDGKTEEKSYVVSIDNYLGLQDGKKYYEGEYGTIYRDEELAVGYTSTKDSDCKLKSLKFYDADKKNLLCEKSVSEQDNQCKVRLASSMIREMEKGTPGSVGTILVQPVFEAEDITVDFSNVVAEAADKVEVVKGKKNEDGSSEYILQEKNGKKKIGSFAVNKARKVGDTIAIDYTPNATYDGDYNFRYYEYRMCQSSNQVSGADEHLTSYDKDKLDLSQKLDQENKYFWVRAHISLKAEVTLQDKVATYDNREVKIDDAVISSVENMPKPTGRITYHYYTDKACTNQMTDYPIDAGTYYVKAVMSQDTLYDAQESNVAKLEIQKAKPTLKNLKGKNSITYGEAIGKTNPTGAAEGVSGQSIEGTFAWTDSAVIPKAAGTATAEVRFTPDSQWAKNYTSVNGMAKVTVNKAAPVVAVTGTEKVYDGVAVDSVAVSVTGVNGEETGQKPMLQFYQRKGERYIEMAQRPVNAGEYYVSAYVAANANYSYAESSKEKITIKQRSANLIAVPVKAQNKLYIYVTNTVNTKDGKPKGTISLTTDTGINKTNLPIERLENGRCYAEYVYGENLNIPESGLLVTASYVPVKDDNYAIDSNSLTVTGEGAENHIPVKMVYGDGAQTVTVDPKWTQVTWMNLGQVNERDVVSVSGDDNSKTIRIKNSGQETLAAYCSKTGENGEIESAYFFYDITVEPAEVTIEVSDKEEKYSGNPVMIEPARVTYQDAGQRKDITADSVISYTYYQKNRALECAPTNAGSYTVEIKADAQRNFKEGNVTKTLTIYQTEPTIQISDKTVTYDGKAHTLDAAMVIGIDGVTVDAGEEIEADRLPKGAISYHYESEILHFSSDKSPTEAGVYTVTATYHPADVDNYAETSKRAVLTIEQANGLLEVKSMEMTYNGKAVRKNTIYFTGVDGKKTEVQPDENYAYLYCLSTENQYSKEAPVEAGIYHVYVVKKAGGNYKGTISNQATLMIKPADVSVVLQNAETVYTGDPADMAVLNPAVVKNPAGEEITDPSLIQYLYYDEEMNEVIPTEAGTYKVQAVVDNQRNYKSGKSKMKELTIQKAVPILSDIKASDISYGSTIGSSEITGTTKGVKGESLSGSYEWTDPIYHEKWDAGSYSGLAVTFTPDQDAGKNYKEAQGAADLQVLPYQTKLKGKNQEEVYTGSRYQLQPVEMTGADYMPEPTGNIIYTYYSDEECTSLVADGQSGVKNAGTYYCKAEFISDTMNYEDVEAVYKINVKKANAAIEMNVPSLGKNLASGEVTIKGVLAGVFDDPTGTVAIYQKQSGEAEDQYTLAADQVRVFALGDGSYGFERTILAEKNVYDFKAVYTDGTRQNYKVADGKCEDVDMSKNPQHIHFEEQNMQKEYGADDFTLHVVDQNNGTGKIRYRLMDHLGNPGSIRVSENGKVQIKDIGTAFVMAIKAGDDNYAPTYAIAAINVVKASVEVSIADQTVIYTGERPRTEEAVVTSHGKGIAEEESLQVTYRYENTETGEYGKKAPVYAGVYTVKAYSEETAHYLASESTSTLTIKKAEAEIRLKEVDEDREKRLISLHGNLNGVFDDPTGTITIYRKNSGQPDDQYEQIQENIAIKTDDQDQYCFEADVPVIIGEDYDFKAVYKEGEVQNYEIVDGIVKKLSIAKAEPVLTVTGTTKVYDGIAIDSVPVSVTGVNGEDTGQTPFFRFYRREGVGFVEMEQAPVNAGEYYVSACVSANANYKSAESSKERITIEKRKGNPIAVPVKTQNALYIYITNTVNTEDGLPKGTINLTTNTGIHKNNLPIMHSRNGRCYAVYNYREDLNIPEGGLIVTVSYMSGEDDNYVIGSNSLTVTGEGAENHVPVEMTYGDAPQTVTVDSEWEQVTWLNLEQIYAGDVVAVTGEGRSKTIQIKNSGQETLVAYCSKTGNTGETESEYLFYDITVDPAEVTIEASDKEETYSGNPIMAGPVRVTYQAAGQSKDITADSVIHFTYYQDGEILGSAPTNAGMYTTEITTAARRNFKESTITTNLTVQKAAPILSNIKASDICYGSMTKSSEITGTAKGVKGEALGGSYTWTEPVQYEKWNAGSYPSLAIIFTPDQDAEKNYKEVQGTADLQVLPYQTELKGKNQEAVYTGSAYQLQPVEMSGADYMPEPTGNISYTYYFDKKCSSLVGDGHSGVTEAGTYYCKVTFVSDTANYENVEKAYIIHVKKADAAIELNVPTLGKNLTSGEVTVKGVLAGVFDDPTGTVSIYQKPSGEAEDQYTLAANQIRIFVREDGSYGFERTIPVEKKVYDFKAVYTDGTRKNYKVADGVCENVDMSKDTQHIYFEEQNVQKEYGTDDFSLHVVDQNNGTGEIRYRLMERIGDPGSIKVSENGKVQIKDTGTAFVMAIKDGDDNYVPTYAIAMVKVVKASVEVNVADQTVIYTGKRPDAEEAVVTSHGKEIAEEEKILVSYRYENVATGEAGEKAPVYAGIYTVKAYSKETAHYLASGESTSTLTIQKAKATIRLKVGQEDRTKQTIGLQGTLQGVIDDPTGSITIYRKQNGQPDELYEQVLRNVEIKADQQNQYYFEAVVPVTIGEAYDFKAVYEDGELQNYEIADGTLEKVLIRDTSNEQDKEEKKDEGKNPSGKDSADKKPTGDQKKVNTGDEASIMFWVILMMSAVGIMEIYRKRMRGKANEKAD